MSASLAIENPAKLTELVAHTSSEWPTQTVEEIGAEDEQPVLTGPFGTNLTRNDFTDSGVPVLTISCLTQQGIRLEKAQFVSADKAEEMKRYQLEPGDLLFSRMASVGRVGIIGEALKGALFNYHVMRLRLNPQKVSAKFFSYYVQGAKQVRDYLLAVNHGATRDGINTSQLLAMPVPVPPLNEQQRIVGEFEKQFTRLDAGTASLKRAQAALKRYRATVLKAACEGRLVSTEAELALRQTRSYEPASALLAHVLERRVKNPLKGRSPIGFETPWPSAFPKLPDGWTAATVTQVSANIVDCPHSTAKFVDAGLPCIDTTCIKPGKIVREKLRYVSRLTHAERVARLVPEGGDLIFAREGTVGTAVVIPADLRPCLGQRVMLMRSDECILPQYFEHCLNSSVVRMQYLPKIVGSTAPHLNVAEVKTLVLPLPPLAEQHRIVAEVERRLSTIEELETAVAANLQRVNRLRQSILQRAFTGKI